MARFFALALVLLLSPLAGYSQNAAQPSNQPQKQGERWGLFIGIEDYDDPRVTDLRYSIDDVQRITEVLREPERGAFQHLKVLTSDATEPEKRPTRINILRALNSWLSGAKPEDTVLFFFSGHGATDDKNRNYLIPVDAQVDLLEDSAIPMERINEILDDRKRIEAQKVIVVLDSCHSGSKVGQKAFMVEGKILDPLFTDAEGRITFASCDRDESSYEYEELGHGVFSYYIAEGLTGAGDRDGNGYIAADELFTYVADSVRSWTKRHGDKQTPRKKMNVTGSILIGYHPENLAQKQEEAAQQEFNAYQRKLRAIIELHVDELTLAEKLLERQMMMREPLTENEEAWAELVRDLADGKISVKIYRLAVQGLGIEPETRVISVKSVPPGASVYFDDQLQPGKTPVRIEDVDAEGHTLRISLAGYKDWTGELSDLSWEKSFTIEGKPTLEITETLVKIQPPPELRPPEKQTGSIFVKSEPPTAQISLDGVLHQKRTPTTITDVMVGRHALKLTLNGYRDWEDMINVEAGKIAESDAKLIQIPRVQTEPQPMPTVKKKSNAKWYLLGGVVAIGGGIAAALLSGGSGGSGDGEGANGGGFDDTPRTTSVTVSIRVP